MSDTNPLSFSIPIITHRIMSTSVTLTIPLGKLSGKKWLFGAGTIRMALGVHERKNIEFLSMMVQKGYVFYDIGANVGYYSIVSSMMVGNDGKVFAFEPNPRNLHLLKKHLSLNNCQNVGVISACVGDKMGLVHFDLSDDPSTSHVDSKGKLRVRMVQIDTLVANDVMPPPDFMKIDVEGAEMLVLKGAQCTLNTFHPRILLSTHNAKVHKQCLEFLKVRGYKIFPCNNNDLVSASDIIAH